MLLVVERCKIRETVTGETLILQTGAIRMELLENVLLHIVEVAIVLFEFLGVGVLISSGIRGIIQYMKRAYNLIIGERTAEEIKINIGSAFPLDKELTWEVRGRDAVSGLPKTLYVSSQEIREALSDSFDTITSVICEVLEKIPAQLSADLVDRGIVLAGGGALIRNLNLRISAKTLLPCFVADDPLRAVVNGTGEVLKNYEFWTKDNS